LKLYNKNKLDTNSLNEAIQYTSGVIYDSISQNLCLVKLNLVTLNACDPVKMTKKIKESEVLLNKSIAELRNIAAQLDGIKEILSPKEKK
jgi:hypothetical protein